MSQAISAPRPTGKPLTEEVISALQTLIWAACLITKNSGHEISPLDVSILQSEIENAESIIARHKGE